MDGVKLSQGYSHYEETVYLLPLSPKEVLELIWSTSKRWKAELTLEPPSGFEARTSGFGIQNANHYAIAL